MLSFDVNVINDNEMENKSNNENSNDYSSSEDEELNLDLPKSKRAPNRIYESSSEEEEEEEESDPSGPLMDSELDDLPQKTKKKKSITKKKDTESQLPLSKEFILNSDEEDVEEPAAEMSKLDKLKQLMAAKAKASTNTKNTKKKKKCTDNDQTESAFAVDFKSTLKLQFSDEEEEEEEEDDEYPVVATPKVVVKKPKETLKKVLMESNALLRRDLPVNLPVSVAKPQSLQLILNEALAHNSRSPAEARKKIAEVKRDLQRKKLEKVIGSERMRELATDIPKIGHSRLDEAVEVSDDDEKATESTRRFTVKLTNLPDFNKTSSAHHPDERAQRYKSHFPVYRKASIEVLNDQLKDKIAEQSNALLARHQRAHAAAALERRAKTEAREKAKRANEVRRERELKENRELKASGQLFTRKEYESIERPVVVAAAADEDEKEIIGLVHKGPSKRIQLSDDDDDDGDDEEKDKDIGDSDNYSSAAAADDDDDLMNLAALDSSTEEEEDISHVPDIWDGLLSGKFDSIEENEAIPFEESKDNDNGNGNDNLLTATPIIKIVKAQKRNEFIDDEASDEDEEMESEVIDEAALDEEMRKSKFIVDASDESDNENFDHRACDVERRKQEDSEGINRLMNKFAGHLQGDNLLDDHDDTLLDSLESKYGLFPGRAAFDHGSVRNSKNNNLIDDEDEELRRLLDPFEQKKRKLAALGPLKHPVVSKRKLFDEEDSCGPIEFVNNINNNSNSSNNNNNNHGIKQLSKKLSSSVPVLDEAFSSDYYASSDNDFESSEEEEDEHGDFYEPVESGIQSRVAEMLNEESLDVEEVQVQASESLNNHLTSFNSKNHNTNAPSSTINRGTGGIKKTTVSVVVPSGNAKLKNRLMALQQENDENSLREKKIFKGFTTVSK